MQRKKIIIGIDPDVDLSGVATLDVFPRKLTVTCLSFPLLISFLMKKAASTDVDVTIVVEAGWLNKGNWHVKNSDNKGQACAKGYHVGRNHQTGILICETARHFGLRVVEQKPLRKMWLGHDKKITAVELSAFTGLVGRTTQDGRDAALIAWTYAGLPISMAATQKKENKK